MTEPTSSNPTLARRFARLVQVIAVRPGAVSDHKTALREVLDALRDGATTISCESMGVADDESLNALRGRFVSLEILELVIQDRAGAADLLEVAKLLAEPWTGSDAGAQFAARLAALDARTVPVRREGDPEPIAIRPSRMVAAVVEPEVAPETLAVAAELPSPAEESIDPVASREEDQEALATEAIVRLSLENPEDDSLFVRAEAAETTHDLQTVLDEIVLLTDLVFRKGETDRLVALLAALVAMERQRLERRATDDIRRLFVLAVRKLARPVLIREIARQRVAEGSEAHAEILQLILRRFGQDGAEAMVDCYVTAPTLETRARALDALRGLRKTWDALLTLSRDTRDLIVRQAAELLGELRDPRGVSILQELLRHPDARARRSAVSALSHYEDHHALDPIGAALTDESPMVRARAIAALADRRGVRVITALGTALEHEADAEVLRAIIAALGSIGTPDAVQRLVKAAEGEGKNSRSRAPLMRIAACTALAQARTPAAMACLQSLAADRGDREVREAAGRLLAQAQRRAGTPLSQAAVSAP